MLNQNYKYYYSILSLCSFFLSAIFLPTNRVVRQQNEGPILENFLKETKKGTTLYEVENLYRPGLVQKSDAKYCKTMVDAFGNTQIDSVIAELVGVEVKTRTTNRTPARNLVL